MDSGWLKALELPAKITGGIFVGSAITLYLDSAGILSLALIGAWLRPAMMVAAIFSGTLLGASAINELVMAFGAWRARKAADAAASAEEVEQAAAMNAAKAKALAHLDVLYEEEIYIVEEALKKGSPSVKWWAHSGGAAQLVQKGLLNQLSGQYPAEHWPFTFRDFAWDAMLKREDEFSKRAAELRAKRKTRR